MLGPHKPRLRRRHRAGDRVGGQHRGGGGRHVDGARRKAEGESDSGLAVGDRVTVDGRSGVVEALPENKFSAYWKVRLDGEGKVRSLRRNQFTKGDAAPVPTDEDDDEPRPPAPPRTFALPSLPAAPAPPSSSSAGAGAASSPKSQERAKFSSDMSSTPASSLTLHMMAMTVSSVPRPPATTIITIGIAIITNEIFF